MNQPPVEQSPRPFRIGGPATASWREHALARAAEYRFLARLLIGQGSGMNVEALNAIESHIDAAERAAAGEDTRLAQSKREGSPAPADRPLTDRRYTAVTVSPLYTYSGGTPRYVRGKPQPRLG